ncbi:endonuclease/exonuclease/phosphatase family protein [Qipengyuania qiaonensis]|uniref:Endonuclease/exonuclease/phosphatase domain-containing protein n=1 Tax=Qipengyuania qiaonensis TaxID=2867240 RepID=A0ABS7JCS4_9SPHN|nr:endonuclease/exonuclease/phosphatase family protein [Qipengyuania qiaonensis]MBX7482787.1 hypothetical protein [Qipengyuania qiaonensis]
MSDLSVATFNLYNLNLPGLPMYRDSDGWSQAEYDRKIDWMAGQLAILRADVFGFQELWHGRALEEAFAAAGLGSQYDLLVPGNEAAVPADGTKIVCAAAVRKGLLVDGEAAEWIAQFPDDFLLQADGDPQSPRIKVELSGFHRPVLHFQIRPHPDEAAVHLYVCHLKSKAPATIWFDDWYKDAEDTFKPHASHLGSALSTLRRTAEATALRWMLTERMKGNDTPTIVLGDLNDGQDSNTLNIITEQPKFLTALSSGGRDNALYSAQAMQQLRSLRDVYYTHVYQDVRESLDHVLASEQFYDMSKKRIWAFDGLTIENDHLNFDNHKENGTGDHGIVMVKFRHKPA